MACGLIVSSLALTSLAQAQSVPKERPRARPPSALTGLADWEKGEALLRRLTIPPAPVRSPEDELATFKVAPGYRVELVAAEPLVCNPIFFEFDPAGRIWVVEYRGYMRDLAGEGEGDPICRVVVLEDTDADGRADQSTVFLDGLVMPRSFAFVKGGLLLQEPPTLWFCEDTDGDLRCDRRRAVGTMGVAGNPQHTANGLRYGIDNWLHNADWPRRHRWRDGKLIEEETIHRGQFGVSFDETGRFLTCYENKALHGDLIPAVYLLRHRGLLKLYQRGAGDRSAYGVNVNLAPRAQEIFPIRPTPAVTLGALELRDDGRLRSYTIASGICAYDGHQFPPDARGNVFVPEAGGHLVGRLALPSGVAPEARRFYPPEQEFLAATDERFRPVNARVGPDGGLYIADMYHGIIEHVIFMVPWLARQIAERRLHEGNDHGRIWRVVAENRPLARTAPSLGEATADELVKTLSHPNGWHRLTAQRLLVERNEAASHPALRKAAGHAAENPLGQFHALWTLHGLGALDRATRLAALQAPDERVRAAAVRLSEHSPDMESLAALTKLAEDPSEAVRLQAVLSLGAFKDAQILRLLAETVAREERPLFRAAAVSGLAGRELELLGQAVEGKARVDPKLSLMLAQCVLEDAPPPIFAQLLELLARASEPPLRHALLHALAGANPRQAIALDREPAALTALLREGDGETKSAARRALAHFTWPGAASLAAQAAVSELTPAEQELVALGRETYRAVCAACHQLEGGGAPGLAPPLAGSDWVSGAPERLARAVLHGLYGPIEVSGARWNGHMPGFATLDTMTDRRIAAVLSYVRRAWGNTSPPIDPALVASVRTMTAGRSLPWRAEELGLAPLDQAESASVKPGPHGELQLPARLATTYGQKLAYRPSLDILAPWRVQDDAAGWTVDLPEPGAYDAFVLLAADDASAGDRFRLETEGSHTIGAVLASGGYDRFHEVPAGRLQLRGGLNRILLRAEGPLRQELADIRAVRLVPTR